MDALNYTATGNRQVEIRQKLYEEFNMPRRTSHSRPWSPQQEEVTDKLTSSRFRRMSEPLPKLSGEGNRYHNLPLSKTPKSLDLDMHNHFLIVAFTTQHYKNFHYHQNL